MKAIVKGLEITVSSYNNMADLSGAILVHFYGIKSAKNNRAKN